MIVVETLNCTNQPYKCGQTDWTMDLPKFNFLPPEDDEDEEEGDDESDGYNGQVIKIEEDEDFEEEDRGSFKQKEIINIEDIKIKHEQEPTSKSRTKKNLVLSDDDEDDEMAEIERKYLGLMK